MIGLNFHLWSVVQLALPSASTGTSRMFWKGCIVSNMIICSSRGCPSMSTFLVLVVSDTVYGLPLEQKDAS